MRRRARVTVGASVLLAAALSVTVGVAVGVLPGSWHSYLWLAWPVSAALTAAYVAVEVHRDGEEGHDGPARLQAREQLLQRVRDFWVKDVLQSSLYILAPLNLGLVKSIDQPHSWGLAPRGGPEIVPPGTSLSDVFGEFHQAMLIVGAPGSGKTTTMLELLRDLLARACADREQARKDEDCTLPIPVVLSLASWALRREPLEEWMLREIVGRYHVEPPDVRAWLAGRQLMPLLDGLDEVAAEHRAQCAEAIQQFRCQHGTVPIVVTCRTLEHKKLNTELGLRGTLAVRPLNRQQVGEFLNRHAGQFAGAQTALAREPGLWELAKTPLMLNIITLAFRDPVSSASLSDGTQEDLRDRLLATYVREMLRHRPASRHIQLSTVRRLAFLARQLQRKEQTLFSSDLLDSLSTPDRLQSTILEVAGWLLWKGITVLSMGTIVMIFYGWRGAIAGGLAGLLAGSRSNIRLDSINLAVQAERQGKPEIPQEDPMEISEERLAEASESSGLPGEDILELLKLEGLSEVERWEAMRHRPELLQRLEQALSQGLATERGAKLFARTMRALRRGWPAPLLRWWLRLFIWWQNYLYDFPKGGGVAVISIAIASGFLLGWAYAAAVTLAGATALAVMTAVAPLVSRVPPRNSALNFPSPGLRAAIRTGVLVAPVAGGLTGGLAGLILTWSASADEGTRFGLPVAECVTLFALGCMGGFALLEQFRIRLALHWADLMPIRPRAFLDRAAQCLLLRHSGDSYLFVHRSMQEFFASLYPGKADDGNEPDPGLVQALVPDEPET